MTNDYLVDKYLGNQLRHHEWREIYPVESVIHHLNNLGLVNNYSGIIVKHNVYK